MEGTDRLKPRPPYLGEQILDSHGYMKMRLCDLQEYSHGPVKERKRAEVQVTTTHIHAHVHVHVQVDSINNVRIRERHLSLYSGPNSIEACT